MSPGRNCLLPIVRLSLAEEFNCWFPLPVVCFFVSVLTLHWHQDCPPLIVFFVGFLFLRFVFLFPYWFYIDLKIELPSSCCLLVSSSCGLFFRFGHNILPVRILWPGHNILTARMFWPGHKILTVRILWPGHKMLTIRILWPGHNILAAKILQPGHNILPVRILRPGHNILPVRILFVVGFLFLWFVFLFPYWLYIDIKIALPSSCFLLVSSFCGLFVCFHLDFTLTSILSSAEIVCYHLLDWV